MKYVLIMILVFAGVIYTDHLICVENEKKASQTTQLQEVQKLALEKEKKLKIKQEEIKQKENKKALLQKEQAKKKRVKQPTVSQKKKNFYTLVVPAIEHIHKEQVEQFLRVKKDINEGVATNEILTLKQRYRVSSNNSLLLALKPHPQSIVIAQAAIESAWGTSRFFREANNIFGMWSSNPNEPRIAAGEKRAGKRTIWLRKFSTLDESIKQYYQTIGRVKSYKEFRELRFKTDDPFVLVKKLDKYSELGDEYTRIIASVIRHNNLTQYDK